MSELRADLDAALRMVEPGQAPVDRAIRLGRRIRARRRVTAIVAVLAVGMVIVVGYPATTHRATGPVPAQPASRPVPITDQPPPPGAPAGVIAMGQVGTTAWQVSADKPSGPGQPGLPQCFAIALNPGGSTPLSGSVLDNGGSTQCDLRYPSQQVPAALDGAGGNAIYVMAGGVAPGVRYLVIQLADGQVIKPIPYPAYGARFVAYAAPLRDRVLAVTAYTSDGQLLRAVPFIQPGGMPAFGLWTAPGQPLPPTATVVLGSGTASGLRWSVTAYEGPWGTCVVTSPGGPGGSPTACRGTERTTSLTVLGLDAPEGSTSADVSGFAPLAATHITVTLTTGHSFQVPVMVVGNERMWSFSLASGQAVRRLTAESAAGQPIGSATMP